MVILKITSNKEKAVPFLSLVSELLTTHGPLTFLVRGPRVEGNVMLVRIKKDYAWEPAQLEQMFPHSR